MEGQWWTTEEILQGVGSSCFNSSICNSSKYRSCHNESLHPEVRYTESSAAWVLIAAIIVFFMKAGFMLLEVSFARSPEDRIYVVVLKHQDAFASAFGFFLIGYDTISHYLTVFPNKFFRITDPILWFFKFTFASNTATIIGGCLVTNKFKLRIPAAFISAFVISGIIHPIVARIVWSDNCDSLSPYRFCDYLDNPLQQNHTCSWNCSFVSPSFRKRMYVLDFAGGGTVHLIGGMAGLVVCLFAKLNHWRYRRDLQRLNEGPEGEQVAYEGFWDWLYPPGGGQEIVSDAALGVLILWFSWFAFNCGSSESIETGFPVAATNKTIYNFNQSPFYGIPAVIAVNMIMAGAAGGTLAILIAIWAQVRYRTKSMNANQIANGVFSALVSITAGCAFVDYWGAVLIGMLGVVVYHIGCYLEYKLKIDDTARVVPVHGLCGLWSMLATGLFLVGDQTHCHLHGAFEGLCYCRLHLPLLSYWERLGAQTIGALIMIGVGLTGSFITYFVLYIIPISPFVWIFDRIFFLSPKRRRAKSFKLIYQGGWLFTHPLEDFVYMESLSNDDTRTGPLIQQDDQRTSGHTNPGNYGSTEAGLGITYRGGRAGSGQEELVESSQGHGVKGLEDSDM